MQGQERQQIEQRREQFGQEWQQTEQQLPWVFGPPNSNAYHPTDSHWVEVNRRDGYPPFRTVTGQPWGSEDTDDPAYPMFWAQLERDDDP